METFNCRVRVRAPKLLSVEAHRIKPLRIFAFAGSYGIGKNVRAVQTLDHADVAARVARQACVRLRMDVLRAYAVADFELGRSWRRPTKTSRVW